MRRTGEDRALCEQADAPVRRPSGFRETRPRRPEAVEGSERRVDERVLRRQEISDVAAGVEDDLVDESLCLLDHRLFYDVEVRHRIFGRAEHLLVPGPFAEKLFERAAAEGSLLQSEGFLDEDVG